MLVKLGSLREFADLKYLAASMELLIDASASNGRPTLDNLWPASIQTLFLSRGMESVRYSEAIDATLSGACNAEVQSLLDACQNGSMALKNFGIAYCTRFPDGSDHVIPT
jgi:hypothetical protein